MAKMKDVVRGAALGTLLGSLAVALYPKRFEIIEAVMDQTNGLGDRAKDYANLLFKEDHSQEMRNHYLSGLAGLVLGAGMTLFLAPKSGKQLRAQVTKAYNVLSEGRTSGINQILRAYHQATRQHPVAHSRPKKAKRSTASARRR